MIRILNYLPASMGSLPKQSRPGFATWLHPSMDSSMPWIISTTGDHEARWECLGYVALVVMCAEGFEEICNRPESVNHLIVIFGNFFPALLFPASATHLLDRGKPLHFKCSKPQNSFESTGGVGGNGAS